MPLQMEPRSSRIRLMFEDRLILSQKQRILGMNLSWLLIESNRHPKISDVCNHLLQMFNLSSSCPNGILLFMEGFVLPASESTRILKDNDIICVKRNRLTLSEVTEGANACNLLGEGEINRDETVNNGVLLLANGEFDKETSGYESESEEEKMEEESLTKETITKKRKTSKKSQSSKKKQKRSTGIDDVEDEVPIEDENIHYDGCIPMNIISKKNKQKKEKKSDKSETITAKVKSPLKDKRKKKHCLGVVNGAEDKVVTVEIDNIDNGEVVKQESTAPDVDKKGPSRSARRKKIQRHWRRELAKISQNPATDQDPEVSKSENKEADVHPNEPLKQDQVPAKLVDKNMITELVPRVIRPGHIRFEPLDEDVADEEDTKHIEVPDVAFQWNGITSKKKGQKWGIEKFSTFQRDDSQKPTEEPSTMLTAATQVPLVYFVDFDQLPLCTSPKEGDVIAYRLLELTSSWTPELSSFRVGKVSSYDGNNILLMPIPEYPIVDDKMDEDVPENSFYNEDGSLEIKFSALVDVRCVKQSNPEAMKTAINGVNQIAQSNDKDTASKILSSSNCNNTNLSKDPNSAVMNKKEMNAWDELNEALKAKKLELLEINEEIKKDSGRNKWSYRALRGSAIGPIMAMLRSSNNL